MDAKEMHRQQKTSIVNVFSGAGQEGEEVPVVIWIRRIAKNRRTTEVWLACFSL